MVDHLLHFGFRHTTAQLDGVPVFLVHVITGPDLFVGIAQLEREVGIAFQVYGRGDFIERGERKHFSSDFEDQDVLAKRRAFDRAGFVRQYSRKSARSTKIQSPATTTSNTRSARSFPGR